MRSKRDDDVKSLTKEWSLLYLASFVLVLIGALAAMALGFIAQNLYAIVAAIFVLLPYFLLTRRALDFDAFGLTTSGWPRGVLWGVAATAITLPLFAIGFYLWEAKVLERDFHFDFDHYRQWPAELEGRPHSPGKGSAVGIWTSQGDLRIALPAGAESPQHLEISSDSPFFWHRIGTARAIPDSEFIPGDTSSPAVRARGGSATTWHVGPGTTSTELVLSPRSFRDTEESLPRHLRIQSDLPLHLGPNAAPAETQVELDRSFYWLFLWALTHFIFVSLPEEFFYRGYLQTRIAQTLRARRIARGQSPEPGRFLGVSAPNLITSALFALGHLLIPVGGMLLLSRAAVFFPSLAFGWLRERTGTIVAPVIYHGACNMMVIIAAVHFF